MPPDDSTPAGHVRRRFTAAIHETIDAYQRELPAGVTIRVVERERVAV